MRRLEPCLSVLPRFSTRVLVLRAGLADDGPLSRGQVARRLDRSVRAVGRIERRGVRRLRIALRNGRCSAATSGGSTSSGTGTAGATGGEMPGSGAAAGGTDGSTGTTPDGQGLPGGSGGRNIGNRVSVKGESEDNLGPFGMFSSPDAPLGVALPAVLLALLALTGLGVWRFRSRQTD